MFYKEKGLNKKQNIVVTLIFVSACWICGVFIPSIGDAITITGATINPVVS